LEFQPENSKAPSEDPILQSQTTGIRIQQIDPPYYLYLIINDCALWKRQRKLPGN
jgi:hypothetical protein